MRSSLFSNVTQSCSVNTDVWRQLVSPLKKGRTGCPETSVTTSHRYVTSLNIIYSTIKEHHFDDSEWWVCIVYQTVTDYFKVLSWYRSDTEYKSEGTV
jgi:hypothetical protein